MFATAERQPQVRTDPPHAVTAQSEMSPGSASCPQALIFGQCPHGRSSHEGALAGRADAHRSATADRLPASARARGDHRLSAAYLLRLQRSIGNRRTTEFIGEARIQREPDGALRQHDRGAGADTGSRATRVEAPQAGPPAPPARSAPPSASSPAGATSLAAPSPTEESVPARPQGTQGAEGGEQRSSEHLDLSSSDAILASLAAVPPSALGPSLASAQAAKASVQGREKAALADSFPTIEKPTGLPPRPRPALPPGKRDKGEAPKLDSAGEQAGERYDTAADADQSPLPASGASPAVTEESTEDEGSWWDWLVNRIRGFLNGIRTTDPSLSTSAGERPSVDLTGAADPSRMGQHEQESAAIVATKQGEADQATTADFGENNIAPDVPREKLRSKYRPAPPGGSGRAGRQAAASAAFDDIVGPSVAEQIQGENHKYSEARSQHEAESAELRAESRRRIAEEDALTRSEQLATRQQACEQVDGARREWRAANARAAQGFSDGAHVRRKETEKQIDAKAADAERQADDELTKAETESRKQKAEAEKKAAEEKRKAENQPRSWWQRFKGAVSSAFSAIRDAVNGIFEAVREKVRQLIQAAKSLVRGIIEAARSAIVGLIRTFGEVLKGLVSIALAAFPEAAERARQWIDVKVETAVEGVNQAAEALKRAADAALDWLGEQLDKLLARLQAIFDSILAAIATIVDLLLNLDEIWARIVAKLREAAPVPPDVAGVLRFFEELRDSIQGPAAAPEVPAGAGSDIVQPQGQCANCEEAETLQRKADASSIGLTIQRDLKPPGNCEQSVHDEMQALVKAWCDPPHWWGSRSNWRSCSPDDRCNMLREKIRRNQLCAQYRRNINDKCYAGGNAGHKTAERQAREAQANCMAMHRAKCEQRPPPVPVPREVVEPVWERFKRFMREHQRELALGVIIACVIAIAALLIPEPVVTKILAGLAALAGVGAFIVLWVKFKNWDGSHDDDSQA